MLLAELRGTRIQVSLGVVAAEVDPGTRPNDPHGKTAAATTSLFGGRHTLNQDVSPSLGARFFLGEAAGLHPRLLKPPSAADCHCNRTLICLSLSRQF